MEIKLNNCFDQDEVPCFIAYRLASDKLISYNSDEYQKYNKLINNI